MKKIFYLLVILASIFISNNLIRSIHNLYQKQDLVTDAREELAKEKNEYERLKDQLDRVKRQDFVEEEARNKLFLVQPGEQIVLVPHEILIATSGAESTRKTAVPHWKEWFNYFFSG
jgi:cell division protein FtsB